MNKRQYNEARHLIRDNGRYALRWMKGETLKVMERLVNEKNATDWLAERADIVAYCRRQGLTCNVMLTLPGKR